MAAIRRLEKHGMSRSILIIGTDRGLGLGVLHREERTEDRVLHQLEGDTDFEKISVIFSAAIERC